MLAKNSLLIKTSVDSKKSKYIKYFFNKKIQNYIIMQAQEAFGFFIFFFFIALLLLLFLSLVLT